MNKFTRILFFVSFMFGFGPLGALPFGPLLGALGVPFLGSAASSAKGAVKDTLTNVDKTIFLAKILLILAIIFLLTIAVVWGIVLIKRAKCKKHVKKVMAVLYDMQADLILLKGSTENGDTYKASIKGGFKELKALIGTKLFKKKLGVKAYDKMVATLVSNKMDIDGQLVLVDQWLKTFSLMGR